MTEHRKTSILCAVIGKAFETDAAVLFLTLSLMLLFCLHEQRVQHNACIEGASMKCVIFPFRVKDCYEIPRGTYSKCHVNYFNALKLK